MNTSFRAILAEKDEEFVYYIKSTRNIHKDDVLDQVRLALLPFDLRSIEKAGWNPMSEKGNLMFPEEGPLGPIYSLKATVGIEMDNERAIQKIALFTHINDQYLFVHQPGESQDRMDNEDEDEPVTVGYKALSHGAVKWDASTDRNAVDPKAQDYAGQKRIDNFMRELETDRTAREGSIKAPKIYEAFVTSHMALRDVNGGETPKKGFYLVERFRDDTSIMHISGPFHHQPINYDFVPDMLKQGVGDFKFLGLGKVQLVEHEKDFRYTVSEQEKRMVSPDHYEVDVTDQDSGKVHHVLVSGINKDAARETALKIVVRREKADYNNLLAGEPEPARN